jgi:hypothetical protein
VPATSLDSSTSCSTRDSDLCLNQIGEKLVTDVIPEGRRPLTICSKLGDIDGRYRPVAPDIGRLVAAWGRSAISGTYKRA